MRAAVRTLASASLRARRNDTGAMPVSMSRASDRIAATCSRIVAGPNPSIIVNATMSRRSKSWKGDVGDSTDTFPFETEQLLPPAAQQLLQSLATGRRNRHHGKRARRVDGRRRIVAQQIHLREDDAIWLLREVDRIRLDLRAKLVELSLPVHRVDRYHEGEDACALDMPEKLKAESLAFVRPFDDTRNVGGGERAGAAHLNDTVDRPERRAQLVGD